MGNTDIESWMATTSDEPEPLEPFAWNKDAILEEWSMAMIYAQTTLLTGNTRRRIQFLRDDLFPIASHADLSLSQNLDIFELLTQTYPRYVDNASRDAVEAVGVELVKRDELRGLHADADDDYKLGVTEQVLGWLSNEVGRISGRGASSSYAPADVFVLLCWSSGLYATCLSCNPAFTSSHSWNSLVETFATLFNLLSTESTYLKSSIRKASLARTKKALRGAPNALPQLMTTLLSQAKSSQAPLEKLPLFGVAIDIGISTNGKSSMELSPQIKRDVLDLFNSSILMSKSPVPSQVMTALLGFIGTYFTTDDVTNTILPTMEKAALRSPELSLDSIARFFHAYSQPITNEVFRRILTIALNCSKSSNSIIRSHSVELFKVIMQKNPQDASTEFAVAELLSLPKAGKTAGPDHRIALYEMLFSLPPSLAVSAVIVQAVPSLLAKETHDTAMSVLATTLPIHIVCLLRADQPLSPESINLIAKEMNSTKASVRRAFCSVTGRTLWEYSDLGSETSLAFAKATLPSLESNLKNVSSNPLNFTSEGYIALAALLGPFSRSGKFGDIISRNPNIQSIVSTSSKPSFLVWEKVYRGVSNIEDETWLLRAIDVVLTSFATELDKSETLRTQLGLVFLHLAVESQHLQTRKSVLDTVEAATIRSPVLINRIMRESLTSFFSRDQLFSTKPTSGSGEDQMASWNKQGRLSALLLHCVSFGEDVAAPEREDVLVELIVLGHHKFASTPSRQTWIELCQKAHIDPHDLVNRNLDRIFKTILAASLPESKPSQLAFAEASHRAVSTLTSVSAEVVLPRVVEQLQADINPEVVNALTDFELGIWTTPEGMTFVDVLSSRKDDAQDKKGKDHEIAKWEAELRKSLANKKTSVSLTKEEQVLVQAQLEKETLIRRRVSLVKANLERGLHFVRSVVSARVPEFRFYILTVASLLLDGALKRGSALTGQYAFDTYLDLAKCCSERLDSFRKWVGVATLRGSKVGVVPEELRAEPLHLLILRVLYRLQLLSENAPFDAATFSYAFLLFAQVMVQGGVGLEPAEDPLEQIALVLRIVKFHCAKFSDLIFPRVQTIENLLLVLRRHPRLSMEASSVLIELGESIHTTASRDEIDSLLRGTLVQEVHVRHTCLQALQPFDLTNLNWSPALWIACHDDDEQNARLSRRSWKDNGLHVPESFLPELLCFLEHANAYVRTSASAAIAEAVESWPQSIHDTLIKLQAFYCEKAKVSEPEFDEYGMVIPQSLDTSDQFPARLAVASTFEKLSPSFSSDEVEPFFSFLIRNNALGDLNPGVRRDMISAGTSVIDRHGSSRLAGLIAMFEEHLANPTPATETGDHIKEAVVILFGRVARHLDASDPRIPSIVNRLVDALKTPSEQVQIAVSDCLPPLVKVMTSQGTDLVDKLFAELLNAPKYAARRGAAYGLAGAIDGVGICGMEEYDVIYRLQTGLEEKKRYESRQGAMFAFETLSSRLGQAFEPYITSILPLLLASFGDSSADVREATQDTARVIMGNMSAHGVNLILPSLLSGLDEKQWRTKKGSVELLGMMAYCSPKQLSLSLPIVIPRLTSVLTDSHAQVRVAANKSLKQFGEVIANPEIQSLVPVLLKALVDPVKIPNALSSLLKTSFVHYIDHSSLALIIPILERGLRERSADTKKKAAQIVGNLASLTDSKDFIPYLSELLPMVHAVLVDPVPEARGTAAKTLGTLVERLGEAHFPDLVPGLLRTLKTDTSSVDQQGAAQGLSEVLSGLGMERLEGLLPDVIANAQSPRSAVREGFMSLLVFLPATFGSRFQPHVPKIITPILRGLSDTEEYVREAAMRAGRTIVINYSSKAIDLLLPELEHGMFDPGWRIRKASITLVGELLFKVAGISGKTEIEDELSPEVSGADAARRALLEVLGQERRDRILSALYLARQDGVNIVRQSSAHIWKALVQNTPRTVREILPELIHQIISLTSSPEPEQQETAGRTTVELCRKFGEKILGEIIAIVRSHSTSPDSRTREGVCLIICGIIENTSAGWREAHEDEIVLIVRQALVDDEANVRAAAAKAFDVLQDNLGGKAIDQTLPTLLEALRQPGKGSGTALQALKEVMAVRASSVFPVLVPTLIALPMTVFNAHALASLVAVAGSALSQRLTVILNALVKVQEDEEDNELRSAVDEALRALFASISDVEGLNTLMMVLIGWAKHDSPKRRVSANNMFATFCEVSSYDASNYRIDWIRQLISGLEDTQVTVHTAAWHALDVFVKTLPKDELEPLVVPLRRSIESTGVPGQHVPGFSLPKGVSPTVPIIIAGLTTGTNEQREQAAYAIGDLVERTEENAMKPFVVPFTGPLIRVATQATTYPPAVKAAILHALTSMLERIPAFVKPFFPQLQRTFIKSASDPASVVVRTKAAHALGVLMISQPRVDPVVTELITGARSNEDSIASSSVLALANVVKSASQNVGEKARAACVELVSDAFKESHDESYIQAVATLVASLSSHSESLRSVVENYLSSGTPPTVISSHTILAVLSADEDSDDQKSSNLFQNLSLLRRVAQKVQESVASDKPAIARPAREARNLLKELKDDSILGLF